jgi:signal transduction histidine kinase
MKPDYNEIAQQWAATITPYTDFDPTSLLVHISDLTEQFLTLMLAESPDYEQARSIGEALAELASHPEALGKTQRILLRCVTAELPAESTVVTISQIPRLLAELAVGFGQVSWEKTKALQNMVAQCIASTGREMRVTLDHLLAINKLLREKVCEQGHDELLQPVERVSELGALLHSFIGNDLEFAKRLTGNADLLRLDLKTFDVSEVIQSMTYAAQHLADEKGNTINIDCPSNLGSMYADERRVRQILLNLLSNACKFTEHGEVSLQVCREMQDDVDTIVFKVSDTGIGIPSERQANLFIWPLRFQGPDFHIGLPICYRFCQMMGGSITVNSKKGRGTTIVVYIPAQVESAC